MKKYLLLLSALLLFTSCAPAEATPMPLTYVPTGILILAIIGLVSVILLLLAFLLFFGGIIEYLREE